jgi:hypothetical protein
MRLIFVKEEANVINISLDVKCIWMVVSQTKESLCLPLVRDARVTNENSNKEDSKNFVPLR